jgi:hypothetical protein
MKIKLPNRDGASLWLEKTDKEVSPNVYVWSLNCDSEHDWVLKYCRYIGLDPVYGNEAIDPSGGPFLSVSDEFEDKYKIVRINSAKNIWISERNND